MTLAKSDVSKYFESNLLKKYSIMDVFPKIIYYLLKNIFWKISLLIYFAPLTISMPPNKHLKTRGFVIFSEGVKRDQWHEMGYSWVSIADSMI